MRPTRVLVEGFEPDAVALARLLASGGHMVRVAGPGQATPEALSLRELGIEVDPHTDLDEDSDAPALAYLDVWTADVARRVRRLRAAGTRVSCLADLVLERSRSVTLGVTGTAGKSTTTAFAVQLLRHAGMSVVASTTGRVGNLWATEEHIAQLDAEPPHDVVALELTSSHLAFCAASPNVAVITSFGPDHLELHGSLAAYREAKERIVRAQRTRDTVVVNEDDPVVAAFVHLTPARARGFSTRSEVEHGAFLRDGTVVARVEGVEVELGPPPGPDGGRDRAAVAAVAAALAVGVAPASLVGAPARLEPLPHRASTIGRLGSVGLVDDGMAATPSKAAALFALYPPESIVAVVGGELELAGRRVLASPAEEELLGQALETLARVARRIVLFGPAGASVAARLSATGTAVELETSLGAAIARALLTCDGARAVVVSPMFPLLLDDRLSIPAALARSS